MSTAVFRGPPTRIQSILTRATGRRGIGTRQSWYQRPNVKSKATPQLRNTNNVKRTFVTDGLPSFLVPPVVFTGLLVALWTYKCIMTVMFQDKIIYMPYMPPFARNEKIEDYAGICKPVEWQKTYIQSLDGTRIALCIGRLPSQKTPVSVAKKKHIIIAYTQGNGSSLPPRLPLLSSVLKLIQRQSAAAVPNSEYTLVGLSYRGYWASAGRASQKGIELDAQAMLRWIDVTYARPDTSVEIILWGQSIGAGVAATAAAQYRPSTACHRAIVTGLVLETPFTGIKQMLLALYPQKWLPYRYLSPFLWNHWDSEEALRRIADAGSKPRILLLPATRDEVVPFPEEVNKLEQLCLKQGLPVERKDVLGALHTEATVRREGQQAVADFVVRLSAMT